MVAVADGTLNRVGWQRLGGWRLWVRDRYRNQFYYAHLSGYSPLALHSRRVKAGDVIGFIGNTGDAFTTPPHLHFEIHPVSLLHLKYDGAVNPTSYLGRWERLKRVRVPTPVHPAFPPGAVRPEARFVWRELLAARGLTSHKPKPSEKPRVHVPTPDGGASAEPTRSLAAADTVHAGAKETARGRGCWSCSSRQEHSAQSRCRCGRAPDDRRVARGERRRGRRTHRIPPRRVAARPSDAPDGRPHPASGHRQPPLRDRQRRRLPRASGREARPSGSRDARRVRRVRARSRARLSVAQAARTQALPRPPRLAPRRATFPRTCSSSSRARSSATCSAARVREA